MEKIIYNKIYARANAKGIVTHIFSEAFEQPIDTDVCIDDKNTERHGAQKYFVVDDDGFYNYEIKEGIFVERDKTSDIEKIKSEELNAQYIPSVEKSVSFFAKSYLKTNPPQDTEEKLMLSGLYDTFDKNNPKKREVGDLVNASGQTYECIQAHDEAVYPDINPNNPQTWHTFYKPLHGKSKETARPFVKPLHGKSKETAHPFVQPLHGKSKETAHPFVQPQFGTTDMYLKGEYMVYTDGKIYKCLSDTVYSPEEYAQAWKVQV